MNTSHFDRATGLGVGSISTSRSLARKQRDDARKHRLARASGLVVAGLLSVASPALAIDLFWDVDGATAGATGDPGGVASGTWDASTPNWSLSSAGSVATIPWDNSGYHTAVFSAQTDATGASSVTVVGTQNVWGITVEEGSVSLTGGTINVANPVNQINTVNAANTLTINSVVGGNQPLVKFGSGTLVLTGNNTFNTAMISAGTVNFNSGAALGTGPILFGGNTGAGVVPSISGTATLVWASGNTFDITSRPTIINTTGVNTLDIGANNVTFAGGIQRSSTGGFTKAGTGTLFLNGVNLYQGDTRIAAGSIQLGNSNALKYSAVDLNTADTGTFSFGSLTAATLGGLKGTRALALTNDSAANVALSVGNNDAASTYSGVLSGGGSLTKVGVSTQTLSGSNTFTGATTIQNGALVLDYATNNNDKIASAQPVTMGTGGGSAMAGVLGQPALRVTGNATAATVQSINGLVLSAGGGSSVAVTTGSNQNATLNLGAITRNSGSAIDFTKTNTGSGVASITTTNPDGRLPSYATVGRADWATVSSGSVNAMTTYATNDFSSAANDVDVTTSSTPASDITVNTLRFNTPNEDVLLTLSGNNTLAAGGILVTPAVGAWFPRISGGTLTSGTSELVIQQHNPYVGIGSPILFPDLVIDSKITGSIGLVKAGAGLTAVTNDNDFTNGTTIASGTLQLGSGGTTGSVQGNIVTNGILGIYRTDSTYTLTNNISGTGGVDVGNEGTRATAGIGRITLGGTNTYSGATRVWNGTLVVDSLARIGTGPIEPKGNGGLGRIEISNNLNVPNPIRLNGRGTEAAPDFTPLFVSIGNNTLSGEIFMTTGGSYYSLESQSGNLTVTGNFYSPSGNRYLNLDGAGDGVYAGRIDNGPGRAFIRKRGAGTWTLTNPNNTFAGDTVVDAGTLRIGATNAMGYQGWLTVVSGATFDLNGYSTVIGNLIGDGTILLPAGSTLTTAKQHGGGPGTTFGGQIAGSGTLVKGGAHFLALSADQTSFSGNIVINGGNLILGVGGTTGSLPSSVPIRVDRDALQINRSDNLTLANIISGRGGLTKDNTNTLELTGPNTFSGTTTINNGVIRLTGPGQLGTSISSAAGAASTGELRLDHPTGFTTANGVLFQGRNGANLTPAIRNVSGNNTVTGPISMTTGGNGVYLLQVDAGKLTFSGDLVSAPDNGRNLQIWGAGDFEFSGGIKIGTISQNGTGTAILSGGTNNTYTGGTNVNSSTLRLGAANSVPSGSLLTVASGATFDMNGFADTVGAIAGAGAIQLSGNLATAAANSTTFSGTMTGSGSFTKGGTGVLTVTSAIAPAGGLGVTAGTLLIPAGSPTSRVGPLSTSGTGKLDITDNQLVSTGPIGSHNGTNYTGVTGLVEAGRNGGFWNGPGVTTSMSDATSGSNYTMLGVATGAEVLGLAPTASATWAGQTVFGSDSLVMYTYGGDANLSGNVDIDDYGLIDFNASTGGVLTGWFNGDFDYNGIQDIDDYGIIDFVVNIQGPPFPTASGAAMSIAAVPEPTAACGFAILTASLLARRRRNQRTR